LIYKALNNFNFQYKSFLIGALSGTFLSGGAAIFYIVNTSEKAQKTKIISFAKKDNSTVSNKLEPLEKTKQKANKNNLSETKASENNENQKDENTAVNDTTIENIVYDTLLSTESISIKAETIKNDFDEIIVKKDELIYSLLIDLQSVDTIQSKKINSIDSLLTKNADIKETDKKPRYTIEYWLSPINYSGYKMANNKLVLFGFREFDTSPELFSVDQKLYFKHFDNFYRVENTLEFKPIRKINDEELIARLQKL
jgi:hypothetical protein